MNSTVWIPLGQFSYSDLAAKWYQHLEYCIPHPQLTQKSPQCPHLCIHIEKFPMTSGRSGGGVFHGGDPASLTSLLVALSG